MVRKRLTSVGRIEKHMHDLSDEVLCARWVENPYYQFFCGELSFCHQLPFDRSSLTHWRQRLGEEQLVALLQESLSVAHKTGALATRDLERVVVDTTVQPKAIAHPSDARLCHRALQKLVDLAERTGVRLRQSYRRVAKRAAIKCSLASSRCASAAATWSCQTAAMPSRARIDRASFCVRICISVPPIAQPGAEDDDANEKDCCPR